MCFDVQVRSEAEVALKDSASAASRKAVEGMDFTLASLKVMLAMSMIHPSRPKSVRQS